MFPVKQYAHDLYGWRLTDAQCAALDAVLESPTDRERQDALIRAIGGDPDTFPEIGDLTRSQIEAEALAIVWVDGCVLDDLEDYDLLAIVYGE